MSDQGLMQIPSSLSVYVHLELEKGHLPVNWHVTAPLGLLHLVGIGFSDYHERLVRPALCVYPVFNGMCFLLCGYQHL